MRRPIAAAEKSRTGHCGIGASRMDLERKVERCMAGIRTGPVGAVGGRSPAEAGTDRTGMEGGHHTLEELCTKRQPGIRLAGGDAHPVAARRVVGSRPAGFDTGAVVGTRPELAGRHVETANLAFRILT